MKIGGFVTFVDNDEAEVGEGGEESGARANDNARRLRME